MADSPLTAPPVGQTDRRALLGYAMVLSAAILFAFNGVVAKVALLGSEISAMRYTQLRTTGAFLGLALALALLSRDRLRVSRRDVPFLVFYGIFAFALVQWLYFLAIEHLPIGIALLIQFTGIVVVALWARLVWHQDVRPRVWAALACAVVGLAVVAQVWTDSTLDALGVAAAAGAAASLAVYFLAGEHAVSTVDPLSVVCGAMLVAAIFWAVVQPIWSFPFDELTKETSLLGNLEDVTVPVWSLGLWTIVAGTIVPFVLSIGALRHLSATRVGLTATFEPVAATLFAWAWLGETLNAAQLVGGGIVLAGIALALTSR